MCFLALLVIIFVVSCAPKAQEAAPESGTVSEEAVAEACADSDDGNNVLVAGTTTKGDVSEKDYCSSADKVVEFYCKDNELQSALTPCPAGLECKDGVCAAKSAVPAKEPVKEKGDQCVDSDSGKKYDVFGVTAKGSESKTDSCDGKSVVEYYCADNFVKSVTSACLQGQECKGGVCTALACVDSDGQNYLTAGKVTLTSDKLDYSDFCNNKFELVERVCKGDVLQDIIYSCGEGYKCETAACVASCFDSDGEDYFTAGVVTIGNKTTTEYCQNEESLIEFSCQINGDLGSIKVEKNTLAHSGLGYKCEEGKYVEVCLDTDGGAFPEGAGYVVKGEQKYPDTCISNSKLKEYGCFGNSVADFEYTCSKGCSTNADGIGVCKG